MDLWSIALEERAKADEERRKSKSIRVFVTSYYGNTVYSPIKGLEQQGKHDGDTNLFFMGSPRCVSILDLLFTRGLQFSTLQGKTTMLLRFLER